MLDEDDNGDAVTSDIRGKVALSSQLNKSEGSALTDVLNKDPQLKKPVKLPQIPKLSISKVSKSKQQQQNPNDCLGNTINPDVKKICETHNLKNVVIEYKDEDVQQINDYRSYVKKFKPRIQLANPSIRMSLLMKLLIAKWNEFQSQRDKKKNISGFLAIDQDQPKHTVSLPSPHRNRKPNCNDPRMKSLTSSSSSNFMSKNKKKKMR